MTLKKTAVSVMITGIISILIISSAYSEARFYAIQIGAYLKEAAAEKKIIELKESGYDPYIFQSINSRNQTLYAVRIGKYNNSVDASDNLSQVQTNLNISAFIAYYDSLAPITAFTKSEEPEEPATPEPQIQPVQLAASEPETENVTPALPEKPDEKSDEPSSDFNQPEIEGPADLATLQAKIQALEEAIKTIRGESDVRKQLKITEKEATAEEEDVLEAAGLEYVLTEAGNIKFTYGFSYSYNEYDAIKASVQIEDVSEHTISNSLSVSYGLKDNISLGASIPFVYSYYRVGTVDSEEVTDLGDLSLNWQFQPLKTNSKLPTIIINGSFKVPVGRSPYEIQVGEDLSTSSGLFSTNLGVSVSQVSDPVIVFGSLSIYYPFKETSINQKRPEGILEEVDPGMGIGIGMGMGYALSYKLSLNVSFGYSYSFKSEYSYKNAVKAKSVPGASANLNLGVGYKLSRTQNLNFRLGLPVTESRQFSFSFSAPIEFEL